MILDLLASAPHHRHLGPGFAAAFDWLARFSPDTADGHYPIDGERVFALVQSYDTVPAAEKKYETHRAYADVQYVATGNEVIHYAPAAGLRPVTEYDEQKDFQLYADPAAATPLHLAPGTFAVFLPHDGHKPGCTNGAACRMKKVVIKVRV